MSASFRATVVKALQTLNVEKVTPNSRIDHHTPGLNYLNLQRSDKFTLKLYLIEGLTNNNGGYLIHPHSHRYDFNTIVMAGQIKNVVLNDVSLNDALTSSRKDRFPMNRFDYSFEEGISVKPKKVMVEINQELTRTYGRDESYLLNTTQIHTLETFDMPTLLCLSQFEDKQQSSSLYLPVGETLPAQTGRIPTLEETEAMRVRCLELLQ
jgi:hypothetical protein